MTRQFVYCKSVLTWRYLCSVKIGKRIEKKFGFNPHLAATLDKRAQ